MFNLYNILPRDIPARNQAQFLQAYTFGDSASFGKIYVNDCLDILVNNDVRKILLNKIGKSIKDIDEILNVTEVLFERKEYNALQNYFFESIDRVVFSEKILNNASLPIGRLIKNIFSNELKHEILSNIQSIDTIVPSAPVFILILRHLKNEQSQELFLGKFITKKIKSLGFKNDDVRDAMESLLTLNLKEVLLKKVILARNVVVDKASLLSVLSSLKEHSELQKLLIKSLEDSHWLLLFLLGNQSLAVMRLGSIQKIRIEILNLNLNTLVIGSIKDVKKVITTFEELSSILLILKDDKNTQEKIINNLSNSHLNELCGKSAWHPAIFSSIPDVALKVKLFNMLKLKQMPPISIANVMLDLKDTPALLKSIAASIMKPEFNSFFNDKQAVIKTLLIIEYMAKQEEILSKVRINDLIQNREDLKNIICSLKSSPRILEKILARVTPAHLERLQLHGQLFAQILRDLPDALKEMFIHKVRVENVITCSNSLLSVLEELSNYKGLQEKFLLTLTKEHLNKIPFNGKNFAKVLSLISSDILKSNLLSNITNMGSIIRTSDDISKILLSVSTSALLQKNFLERLTNDNLKLLAMHYNWFECDLEKLKTNQLKILILQKVARILTSALQFKDILVQIKANEDHQAAFLGAISPSHYQSLRNKQDTFILSLEALASDKLKSELLDKISSPSQVLENPDYLSCGGLIKDIGISERLKYIIIALKGHAHLQERFISMISPQYIQAILLKKDKFEACLDNLPIYLQIRLIQKLNEKQRTSFFHYLPKFSRLSLLPLAICSSKTLVQCHYARFLTPPVKKLETTQPESQQRTLGPLDDDLGLQLLKKI